MSSSQFQASSEEYSSGRPRKSRFTFGQLKKLASFSTNTPLRTVAHIDLDAFYAQCEMVRGNVPEDQPLAVQQWQGLIAINYPAKKFGLGRHVSATEAKKMCPDIILKHVATFKEGETTWAYHDDAPKNMTTHKVSLDPYRLESRKIIACIKEALPAELQRVEKAGIDEVFVDLSAQVHEILMERYPELLKREHPPYNDPTENLPWPEKSTLDWSTDSVVSIGEDEHTEEEDPDWDDVCLNIGAEIVRGVRKVVREKLKYTMSGGIARNKMLAKLGSGYQKPNQQSVIRARAAQAFMNEMKLTKIRMLGGKLGDDVVAQFQTDSVKELLNVPLEQFQNKLGDDTGAWLYDTVRGHDHSEVTSRTNIKSMLSAKAFRPYINNFETALRWIRIFAADLFGRCVEEGVLENKRRPKSITLHHLHAGTHRSRQMHIPPKQISEEMIFDLGKQLLAQTVADGRVWPCVNLSLSLVGFEDNAMMGNMGIKGFLVPEDELSRELGAQDEPPVKRQRMENEGIKGFLVQRESSNASSGQGEVDTVEEHDGGSPSTRSRCEKCGKDVPVVDMNEHQDWHFAKELNEEMRRESEQSVQVNTAVAQPKATKTKASNAAKKSKIEPAKGQMKLNFGNR
jgi:DNA polymerase eta